MPTVTAIIVTRNRVAELGRAVRSVVAQTYPDIEIIVVNDASEDGTKQFLDGFQARGVARVINLEKREGACRARNLGVAASHGQLVAFLDDDDWWHPTKIAEQVPLFDAPDVGAVYCAMRIVFDHERYVVTKPTRRGHIGNDIFTTMLATTSAMMYSRGAYDAVGGFDEDLTHWQDLELNIRIAQNYAVDFVPQALVDVSSDTTSTTRLSNQFDGWLVAVHHIRAKHASEIAGLSAAQRTKFELMCADDGLNRLYNAGQRRRWWRSMLALFMRHPSFSRFTQVVTAHDQLDMWKWILPKYEGSEIPRRVTPGS